MDVQLAGQDGLELTRQLTADTATASIPIVALTAHAMAGDREQAVGCIYSVVFTTPDLARRIDSLSTLLDWRMVEAG